jgi:hypothetical protein
MPDLRELLHDAAPIATRDVDLDAVHARVRQRARRRRALVGGVAVVLLLVIGATAAAVMRDDDGRRIDVIDDSTTTVPTGVATTTTGVFDVPTGTYEVAYQLPDGYVATAVLNEGQYVWVAAFASPIGPAGIDIDEEHTGTWVVVRLDHETGDVVDTVGMPGAVRGLAGGEDVVWAWGGGDGGEPIGGAGAIDRRRPRLIGTFGWDAAVSQDDWMSPAGFDAAGDSAWMSDASHDVVYQLTLADDAVVATPIDVGAQPTDVVVLTDGSLWVREARAGTIAQISIESASVTDRVPWSGTLLEDGGDLVWADDGTRLVELYPPGLHDGLSVAQGRRVTHGVGWLLRVVRDAGGLWVIDPTTTSVRRYAFSATGEDPVLVAQLGVARASDIAPDGDRLLLVDSGSNAIGAWTPPR